MKITGKIYLNSCQGGTSKGTSESVASIISKKISGRTVRAVVNGSVYYPGYKNIVLSGNPYTKERGAYWADFSYKYSSKYRRRIVNISNRKRNWSL